MFNASWKISAFWFLQETILSTWFFPLQILSIYWSLCMMLFYSFNSEFNLFKWFMMAILLAIGQFSFVLYLLSISLDNKLPTKKKKDNRPLPPLIFGVTILYGELMYLKNVWLDKYYFSLLFFYRDMRYFVTGTNHNVFRRRISLTPSVTWLFFHPFLIKCRFKFMDPW